MNGGVTYRRTNAPNLSSKDGLGKEIEIHKNGQQEHEFFWMEMSLVGQEEEVVGGRRGEGPGGTHTMSRHATLPAAPAGGVGYGGSPWSLPGTPMILV